MPNTSASVIIDAPAKAVFDVITDFESYPEFLSDTKEVEIISRTARKARARFAIKVIKTVHYTLDYKFIPYKRVSWTFVSGNLFKDCYGFWELREKGKGRTEAVYDLTIDFNLFIPDAITKMLIGNDLPGLMRRFKERTERLAAGS